MSNEQIIAELNQIFQDILDRPDVKLAPATTANDVEGWDSLTHIQLVVAIEKHFGIKFSAKEIRGFKNVGEMCDSVRQHKG
jgi:acyl carrier protein